jgi:glycosyltransferase involved in cell wall biosynthesis
MSERRSPTDLPVVFANFWAAGGMRHYADSVVEALSARTRVVYLRNYSTTVPCESEPIGLSFPPVTPSHWNALRQIRRTLQRSPSRAVHLNNEQPALLPLYPRLAGLNSVITLHDARSHAGESLQKRAFHLLHLRLVRRFVRKVIVHSEAIRDALPAWFPRARVHIVPHVNYRRWARASPAAPAPPLRVLFFGRILAYKGLDVLLEAFAPLDPQHFHLTIAGEGAMPPVSAPNIDVLNRFVSDDEMAELFQAAHAVALPYRAASQSGVAHMAFAFGRPVVATRVGALAEAVRDGENGILVPPGDAAALSAALQRLAETDLRQRFEATIASDQLGSDAEIGARLLAVYDA